MHDGCWTTIRFASCEATCCLLRSSFTVCSHYLLSDFLRLTTPNGFKGFTWLIRNSPHPNHTSSKHHRHLVRRHSRCITRTRLSRSPRERAIDNWRRHIRQWAPQLPTYVAQDQRQILDDGSVQMPFEMHVSMDHELRDYHTEHVVPMYSPKTQQRVVNQHRRTKLISGVHGSGKTRLLLELPTLFRDYMSAKQPIEQRQYLNKQLPYICMTFNRESADLSTGEIRNARDFFLLRILHASIITRSIEVNRSFLEWKDTLSAELVADVRSLFPYDICKILELKEPLLLLVDEIGKVEESRHGEIYALQFLRTIFSLLKSGVTDTHNPVIPVLAGTFETSLPRIFAQSGWYSCEVPIQSLNSSMVANIHDAQLDKGHNRRFPWNSWRLDPLLRESLALFQAVPLTSRLSSSMSTKCRPMRTHIAT